MVECVGNGNTVVSVCDLIAFRANSRLIYAVTIVILNTLQLIITLVLFFLFFSGRKVSLFFFLFFWGGRRGLDCLQMLGTAIGPLLR